jgi:hypothetical protein
MTEFSRKFEELNDELWISDLVFPVDVTGHLNSLKKELQSKDNIIPEMSDNRRRSKLSFNCGKINSSG